MPVIATYLLFSSFVFFLIAGSKYSLALAGEESIKAPVAAHTAMQPQLSQFKSSFLNVSTVQQQFHSAQTVLVAQFNSTSGDWQGSQEVSAQACRLWQPWWAGRRWTAGHGETQANSRAAAESFNVLRQPTVLHAVQVWADGRHAVVVVGPQANQRNAWQQASGLPQRLAQASTSQLIGRSFATEEKPNSKNAWQLSRSADIDQAIP